MGMLNNALPFEATQCTTVPAQPGWFVFDWAGPPDNVKVRKAPIVAWLVETELYPKPQSRSLMQDSYLMAYPVSPAGFECEDSVVLGPYGIVYRFSDGESWPDIDWYIQHERTRMDAEDAALQSKTVAAQA